MKNTTITFTRPNVAELVPGEVRQPVGNEVLVKLAVSTISSGTERANLTGDANVGLAAARRLSFRESAATAPRELSSRSETR